MYANADLQNVPQWQGTLADLREEIGHSLAVFLFDSPDPPDEWSAVMTREGLLSAEPGRAVPREDWALAVALWLKDEAAFTLTYPQRAQLLRRFGFGLT